MSRGQPQTAPLPIMNTKSVLLVETCVFQVPKEHYTVITNRVFTRGREENSGVFGKCSSRSNPESLPPCIS